MTAKPEPGIEMRDGKLEFSFAVAGHDPVPDAHGERHLDVDQGFATFYGTDSVWQVGVVQLSGRWTRKTDGQPSSRKGTLLFSPPWEDHAPAWLPPEMESWERALNTRVTPAARAKALGLLQALEPVPDDAMVMMGMYGQLKALVPDPEVRDAVLRLMHAGNA